MRWILNANRVAPPLLSSSVCSGDRQPAEWTSVVASSVLSRLFWAVSCALPLPLAPPRPPYPTPPHPTPLPAPSLSLLEELDCSCNELETLPPTIGYLHSLRTFAADENFLTELPREVRPDERRADQRLALLWIRTCKKKNLLILQWVAANLLPIFGVFVCCSLQQQQLQQPFWKKHLI